LLSKRIGRLHARKRWQAPLHANAGCHALSRDALVLLGLLCQQVGGFSMERVKRIFPRRTEHLLDLHKDHVEPWRAAKLANKQAPGLDGLQPGEAHMAGVGGNAGVEWDAHKLHRGRLGIVGRRVCHPDLARIRERKECAM
jgi:hypothetical protein